MLNKLRHRVPDFTLGEWKVSSDNGSLSVSGIIHDDFGNTELKRMYVGEIKEGPDDRNVLITRDNYIVALRLSSERT